MSSARKEVPSSVPMTISHIGRQSALGVGRWELHLPPAMRGAGRAGSACAEAEEGDDSAARGLTRGEWG
jgi:hypothetical protein